jgi:hypothetical protein
MSTPRETLEHLFACFDTMYLVFGESAPRLRNDAYLIRAYEASRAFGDVALAYRTHLGRVDIAPLDSLEEALRRAVESDESGAMALYCLTSVVGPRVLVSLVDARSVEGLSDAERVLLDLASQTLVAQIRLTGDVARGQTPIEDEVWQRVARSLSDHLDSSGYVESFGISH